LFLQTCRRSSDRGESLGLDLAGRLWLGWECGGVRGVGETVGQEAKHKQGFDHPLEENMCKLFIQQGSNTQNIEGTQITAKNQIIQEMSK
jgi:hypothetical protein